MNIIILLKLGTVVVGLVELVVSCRIANLLLEEKNKEDVNKWQLTIAIGLIILVMGMCNIVIGPSPITALSVLTCFFLFHLLLYNGSIGKRLLVVALCGIIISLSDVAAIMLFGKYRLLYPPASLVYETYWTLMGIGSKVICFMVINTIYRIVKRKEKGFTPVELVLHVAPIITLYTIDLVIQCNIQSISFNVANAVSSVLISIGLLLVNILTWSVFDTLIKNEREKQFYLMCQENVKQQYEFYRNQEAKEEATRRIWHDIHNHLQCVHDLIREGYSTEANQYLHSLEKDIAMLRGQIRTGHLIIDAILTDKYGMALAYDISMVMKVDGQLLNAIQDIDLCVIYSNLIDNAIEACRKNDIKSREILIITKQIKQYIAIEVMNSCNGNIIEKNGRFITTKTSSTGHGIGLSNVRHVIEKYEGEMKVDYNATTFNVQIFLPLTKTV